VDGGDRTGKFDAAETLDTDSNAASGAQLRDGLLRHAEVDVDGIQSLQRHQRVAAGQVLSEVDVADAEDARERRLDCLSIDRGADLADARVALSKIRLRTIELGLRDDVLTEEPLHPLEIDPREVALCLGRGDL